MADLATYPTDQAICRLLAGEALPTAAIAGRLALPERTARHRLLQLRRAGLVVSGADGLHRLAVPAGPHLAAGTLPATDDQDDELAVSGPTPATNGSAVVLVGAMALAVGCVAAVIWAARRSVPDQAPAQLATLPGPAWPYGIGWPRPGSW